MQLHSYRHIFVRIKIETIYLLILYIAMKNENPALEKYAELRTRLQESESQENSTRTYHLQNKKNIKSFHFSNITMYSIWTKPTIQKSIQKNGML